VFTVHFDITWQLNQQMHFAAFLVFIIFWLLPLTVMWMYFGESCSILQILLNRMDAF
jgi:hypothetical protein